MFRFVGFCVIIMTSILSVEASSLSLNRDMARDLSSILESRQNIENLAGTGRTYRAFTQYYFDQLDSFVDRYAIPFRVFALRPTVDMTLSYRLRIQDYALSCEITALRIILERLGVLVSEQDIFANIPLFLQIYGSGDIWGDPDKEFVGFYTGSQAKRTGYGIYELPLSLYAQDYGLRTQILSEIYSDANIDGMERLTYLLGQLGTKNKNILLWGDYCTDPKYEDGVLAKGGRWMMYLFPLPARNSCQASSNKRLIKWATPAGKEIVGLSGEHAFVLLGYVGSIKKPTHIIVWDTYTGRHIYPYSEWMRKWSLLQYRSLIISQ